MGTTRHIVQTKEWAEAKVKFGTQAVEAGGTVFTKHKIPFTNFHYGYCPKVNPFEIVWEELRTKAVAENVIAINFDCPNVLKRGEDAEKAKTILEKKAVKAKKETFAKFNVLLDLTSNEEELLTKMHHKTRYNIKYAEKNGVTVQEANSDEFEKFSELHKQTAERQKFYIHSEKYYKTIWETLFPKNMAKILFAQHEGKILSAWMLFIYDGVLYYPYGGWSGTHRELFPNNALCWEAIKLGKSLGLHTFDMWGASKDPNDTTDPWGGFTKFKLGFGGRHVEYLDSYDLVLNAPMYHSFNIVNEVRWKVLRMLK
ncbi:MAG: peptidoglycan bridge formation glycyltransferase FemA/FemB family protein [Patescibacteria group bacterium]